MLQGMLIAMSLVKKEDVKEYWNNSRLLCTPGIQELMPCSRFCQLYRNLVLRPITDTDENNDMLKIKRIRDRIISNSRTLCEPERHLSLDECMVPFSGCHTWKVFLKSKPVKYGFKAYVLAEASTGYILNWHVHTGDPMTSSEESSTFRIVRKLCKPYEDRGFYVFMDRYYSGLRIFRYLSLRGFGACGTIMSNRLKLSGAVKEDLENFDYLDYDFYQFGKEILLTAWKDKKLITMLSTVYSTNIIKYRRIIKGRDENNKSTPGYEDIEKPLTIAEYAKFMGGVDRFDKMLYNYHFYHKNCRWYIRIFTHFLELAILNSYVIYTKQCKRKHHIPMSRYCFHEYLAKELVKSYRDKNNIASTPKKEKGKTQAKIFIAVENLLIKSCLEDCEFEDLASKADCTVCRLENKRAQCNKICVTHDAAVHIKCYEKHKKICKNLPKKR